MWITEDIKVPQHISWATLLKAPIGEPFDAADLEYSCKYIYGGVSWPGKQPGFAVVLAMDRFNRFGSYDICLLDEFESFDMDKLVRQCGALNLKYRPALWIGDRKNDAADRFIRQMNCEMELPEGSKEKRHTFYLTSTHILQMEQLYPYILAAIKRLLEEERRQLFLKDSKVLNYLHGLEESEVYALELGDYPAIEALGFVVCEMRERSKDRSKKQDYGLLAKKYRSPWSV